MGADEFAMLVDAHYAALYRFALSLSRSQADACDLTQETFHAYARHGATLRDHSKAKSWLFTTLYREFLRLRRRDQRLDSIEETDEQALGDGTWDKALLARLDGQTVLEALQGLDERFRAPLSLFYLESFAYQEIAATLGVPIGTVMSRIARGKALLREALTQAEAGKVLPFPAQERKPRA